MKMLVQPLLVLLAAVSVTAIKVPIGNPDVTKVVPVKAERKQSLPIFYVSDEENVDSYLVHPDAHKQEEAISELIVTPATYLLPPSPESQNEYLYKPTEPGEQSEWYPITPQKPIEITPFIQQEVRIEPNEARGNLRKGKVLYNGQALSIPSRHLLPPIENAPDEYVVLSPSAELELPAEEIDHNLNKHINIELPVPRPSLHKTYPIQFRPIPESYPVSYIMPPKQILQGHKNPTKLYPKKYTNTFKPVPIPVSQYVESDDHIAEPPPKPILQHDIGNLTPTDEKKKYLYDQSQKKRKLKQQNEAKKLADAAEDAYQEEIPAEQEASESYYSHRGNAVRPSQLKQEPVKHKPVLGNKGERTEFRMHGMKGPHSYQFGYDTGKGKNRQFRYEERDNDGHVKGHYGYVDKFGKLRVVNYDADPEHGFRAEAPVIKE